jgi:hypothetical protein
VKGGVIQSVKITGDFLALRSVSPVESKLVGVPFEAEALDGAITDDDVSGAMGSISKGDLLSVFF